VIPCGVARDVFSPEVYVRKAAGQTAPFVIGFLGSLKPWHGVEILLEAFEQLLQKYTAYRLLVVGDGPLRGMVEDFRRARRNPECVTITGEVANRDVPRYLAQMDVGVAPYPVLPTFYFSPLKIFEYAAAGVPIVASASGQIAEVLVHRRSAMLYPPDRPTQIVSHIEKLRARPERRARLARRARRAVARDYTWDKLAVRFLSVVRDCVPSLG
jgi:glycosyltransferase involved in cell wall biosynthesis